jgi:hypothetical protein
MSVYRTMYMYINKTVVRSFEETIVVVVVVVVVTIAHATDLFSSDGPARMSRSLSLLYTYSRNIMHSCYILFITRSFCTHVYIYDIITNVTTRVLVLRTIISIYRMFLKRSRKPPAVTWIKNLMIFFFIFFSKPGFYLIIFGTLFRV